MKAAFLKGIGTIEVEETDIPKVGKEDVLIKVDTAAICGTDIRIFNQGHFKIKEGEKRVLGHEIVGEIVETGSDVRHFKNGMRVAVVPNIGCGHCPECIRGFNELCADYEAFGISINGGFEEYMHVPGFALSEQNILEIPEGLGYRDAILAEPLSCCYNSYRALNTKPGETVLVIGAGPIGALHVIMNGLAGAGKIISADISEKRLQAMKDFGADVLINSGKESLREAVMENTNGRGADVVIVACSVPQLQKEALHLAAPHGRISFFGGLPEGKSEVVLDTNLMHYKELKLLGTTGSSKLDYMEALGIIASGKINVKGIITNEFKLEEIGKAFEFAMSGQGMKTVITF